MNQQNAFAIEKKKNQNWVGNFPSTTEQTFTCHSDPKPTRDEIKTSQANVSHLTFILRFLMKVAVTVLEVMRFLQAST